MSVINHLHLKVHSIFIHRKFIEGSFIEISIYKKVFYLSILRCQLGIKRKYSDVLIDKQEVLV